MGRGGRQTASLPPAHILAQSGQGKCERVSRLMLGQGGSLKPVFKSGPNIRLLHIHWIVSPRLMAESIVELPPVFVEGANPRRLAESITET